MKTARALSASLALVGTLALFTHSALADGDAEAGKNVFKKCAICHSPEAGKNKIGPSLFGVVGRPSASVPGYNYSTAMKNFNKVWTEDLIFQYLSGPQKMIPGIKMTFVGLPNEKDRYDVIAYLKTLK